MKKTSEKNDDGGQDDGRAARGLDAGAGRVAQFEISLKELEAIVQQMEKGDLKLEESLKLFERGTVLTQQCKTALEAAELRVKQLMSAAAKSEDDKT